MLRAFFILLFYTSAAYGQVDPSKIKVITKTYYECIPSREESISGSYPFIQTQDKELNKFINDTIRKLAGVKNKTNSRKITCWDGIDISSKPTETDFTFQIDLVSSRFISLTLHIIASAGGGGSGFSDTHIPVTFDLKARKILKLNDVIKNELDSFVYKIITDELKRTNENVISDFNNEENLENISSIVNHSISITKKGIVVYWTFSYGRGDADAGIHLDFDKNENIFKKRFLNIISRK